MPKRQRSFIKNGQITTKRDRNAGVPVRHTVSVIPSCDWSPIMKLALVLLLLMVPMIAFAGEIEEQNKALARRFYEEAWFKNNPGVVDELFAPTYIAHDIGARKNSMEQASEQKDIAQF